MYYCINYSMSYKGLEHDFMRDEKWQRKLLIYNDLGSSQVCVLIETYCIWRPV